MSRKYKYPPIIEAICEFRLAPDTKWDLTVPGLLYEKIRGDFPIKEQKVVPELDADSITSSTPRLRLNERVIFLKNDKKTFMQVGQNLLAVNRLKPYESWNNFQPDVELALKGLMACVDVGAFQRIGLRYINKIEIKQPTIKLEDYFDFRPNLGERLPKDMSAFTVGCELPFNERRDICRMQLTSAVSDAHEASALLLDFDYFLLKAQNYNLEQTLEWINNSHAKIEQLFEGCIQDSLRHIFGEE